MSRIIGPGGAVPWHRRRRASLTAAAVAVVLTAVTWLAGAASGGIGPAAAAADQPPGSSPSASPSTGPPAASPPSSPPPSSPPPSSPPSSAAEGADGLESAPLTFGQRFTWPSGIAVEVAQPAAFYPSRSATGATGNRVVLVRTTVRNGGKQPYRLDVFSFGPEATYGGVEATKVVDRAQGTGDLTDVVVAPGGSFTYATALAVGAGPGLLELDYTEALGDDDPAIFVGRV
jgi:hypothetical protein